MSLVDLTESEELARDVTFFEDANYWLSFALARTLSLQRKQGSPRDLYLHETLDIGSTMCPVDAYAVPSQDPYEIGFRRIEDIVGAQDDQGYVSEERDLRCCIAIIGYELLLEAERIGKELESIEYLIKSQNSENEKEQWEIFVKPNYKTNLGDSDKDETAPQPFLELRIPSFLRMPMVLYSL